MNKRADGRAFDEMRPVKITPNFIKFAEGSVLIECGDTKVLCCASVEEKVPPHVKPGRGWVTAEYSMLPRANRERSRLARGNMEYSAVTQPWPGFTWGGTFSSTLAQHSTLVSPHSIRTLPSANLIKFGVIFTGRISSNARPSALFI